MGPPTVAQRIDQLEEKATGIEEAMADMVSRAVDTAMSAMKQSLTELLVEGQQVAAKKQSADLDALANRLEGRLSRAREHQEQMINVIRADQLRFQADLKSTITGLQPTLIPMVDKLDSCATQVGSSSPGPSGFGGGRQNKGESIPLGDGGGLGGVGLCVAGGAPPGFNGCGLGQSAVPGGAVLNWRFRKLDMPVFDGTDPDGWLLRVERYFAFYKLSEAEMLDAVVVAFEGDALRFYQWEQRRRPIRLWVDLKDFILRQFRSASGGSLYEQWLSTTQETTVMEYRRRFIETAAPLDRVSEAMLLGQFINGLKDDIKAEVRLINPVSLDHAMEVAIRVEEKCRLVGGKKHSVGSIKTGSLAFSSPYSAVGAPISPTTATRSWVSGVTESQASVYSPKTSSQQGGSSKFMGEVKRLTDKELQEKKAKGLCFRCDEKWSMGHRCRKKELSVLLMGEEGEDEGDGSCSDPPLSPTEELTTEVSLNSVVGLSNPKTMKLLGLIGDMKVVVMVDPGATHNFLSLKVIDQLHIPVTTSGIFAVSLGNGEAIRGQGVCKGVTLQLDGGVEVLEDFFTLDPR